MESNILFVGLDTFGEKIIEKLHPLLYKTTNSSATITTQTTLNHPEIQSIEIKSDSHLSLDLICTNYNFISKELNVANTKLLVFIGKPSPICRVLAYLANQKKVPFVFCLSSNEKKRLSNLEGSLIINIQDSDDYGFIEKVTDLTSLLDKKSSIDWQKLNLLLQEDCYQEIMNIDISNEENLEDEIEKTNNILKLDEASFNIFLLINCKDDTPLKALVNRSINKISNSLIIDCRNSLIAKEKLSVISIKKVTDEEVQLGFNFNTEEVDSPIKEEIDPNNLSIPTFKRQGVHIDQGF